jgi:hypothetical protein
LPQPIYPSITSGTKIRQERAVHLLAVSPALGAVVFRKWAALPRPTVGQRALRRSKVEAAALRRSKVEAAAWRRSKLEAAALHRLTLARGWLAIRLPTTTATAPPSF